MTYSKNSGTALTARRRTDSQKNKVILIQFAHSHSTYLENRTRQRSAVFTRLKKSLRILPKSNEHKTPPNFFRSPEFLFIALSICHAEFFSAPQTSADRPFSPNARRFDSARPQIALQTAVKTRGLPIKIRRTVFNPRRRHLLKSSELRGINKNPSSFSRPRPPLPKFPYPSCFATAPQA